MNPVQTLHISQNLAEISNRPKCKVQTIQILEEKKSGIYKINDQKFCI